MSGIIFLSSVQQWSKKSVSYKVNACDHQFSSNRLARQNGVPWQISSKYLKITNENDESASPLCLLFFFSYAAWFFFPTLHMATALGRYRHNYVLGEDG